MINRGSLSTNSRTKAKSRRSASGKEALYVFSTEDNKGSEQSLTGLHITIEFISIRL